MPERQELSQGARNTENCFNSLRLRLLRLLLSSKRSLQPPLPNPRLQARLTNLERETLFRTGSCFNCKQQGHKAADCPLKAEKRMGIPETGLPLSQTQSETLC